MGGENTSRSPWVAGRSGHTVAQQSSQRSGVSCVVWQHSSIVGWSILTMSIVGLAHPAHEALCAPAIAYIPSRGRRGAAYYGGGAIQYYYVVIVVVVVGRVVVTK